MDIHDEKTKPLDKLLDIDRKLASGEIKKDASITRERNKLIKKYRSLGANYDWAKNLFKKLQINTKSALFTEETVNDKILQNLKKSRYNKDIELITYLKVILIF